MVLLSVSVQHPTVKILVVQVDHFNLVAVTVVVTVVDLHPLNPRHTAVVEVQDSMVVMVEDSMVAMVVDLHPLNPHHTTAV